MRFSRGKGVMRMKAGFWQLKTVTKIFAAVLLGLAMFELAMVLLLPGIAKTQSRVISVVFASVLAAVVSGIFACRRAGLENELKKSADFYLTLLYDFPYLIWRSDVDGHYDYFNGAWLRFTGRTLEQEQGEGWLDSVHPEDRETCLHIYNDIIFLRQFKILLIIIFHTAFPLFSFYAKITHPIAIVLEICPQYFDLEKK